MCAIVGIAKKNEASNLCYLGLHAQQHRGQEGAGIVSFDRNISHVHRRKGLVGEIFTEEVIKSLPGSAAIGHVRYSTTGASNIANLQPLRMKCSYGLVALAHNGNLVNAKEWTQKLEKEGSIFQSTNDTEVIVHLIARSQKKDLISALTQALEQLEGAYSLVCLTNEHLIAARDPHGFRPLVIGDLDGTTVFASETVAFDLLGAKYVREVEPGEIIVVSLKDGKIIEQLKPFESKPLSQCIFEHIYFARPDSTIFGGCIHETRKALGRQLAKEQPAPDADLVIPVPDSGVPAAIGYAEQAGIPFDMAIIRSHYVGRTFIEPKESIRHFGVRLKLGPVSATLKGKNIVVIDDSLVRGTTSKKLIKTLRDAGATKIHLRISAPPTTHSCYYGIDTPTREELLASHNTIEFIRDYIGVDTLAYISLKGLVDVASQHARPGWCHACFSGDYPTDTYSCEKK